MKALQIKRQKAVINIGYPDGIISMLYTNGRLSMKGTTILMTGQA